MVLCVGQSGSGTIEGYLYHGYSEEGIPFRGYEEIIRIAEDFFNALRFPHKGTGDRDIHGHTLKDEDLLKQHGDMGTFVIRVQHRQHSSWQGRVTYIEDDRTVYFRSALELIKIIDGTLDEAERTGNRRQEEG